MNEWNLKQSKQNHRNKNKTEHAFQYYAAGKTTLKVSKYWKRTEEMLEECCNTNQSNMFEQKTGEVEKGKGRDKAVPRAPNGFDRR